MRGRLALSERLQPLGAAERSGFGNIVEIELERHEWFGERLHPTGGDLCSDIVPTIPAERIIPIRKHRTAACDNLRSRCVSSVG